MEDITAVGRIRKIGGSFTLTIPMKMVREQNLVEDELVEVKVRKRRINGFGIFRGIGPYKREEDRMKDRDS